MKKLIVIIAFTFFIQLPVYSWIQPNGGININKWEHNKEVEIAWRFTVDTLAPTADTTIFEVVTIAKLDSVTIDLWDAKNSRYINIVTNYVDTNNVYNWTIPDSLDVGNHYKIKVSNANDSNFYQLSRNFFPIFEAPSPKPIFQTEREEESNTFKIFPNPVKDKTINIVSEKPNTHIQSLKVIDMSGLTIFEVSNIEISGNYNLHLPNISRGAYIIQISTPEKIETKKLIIE